MELKEEISEISADKSIYGKEFQVDDISDTAANMPSNALQNYQLSCYENLCVCCGYCCIGKCICMNVLTCCICSKCCSFTYYLGTSYGRCSLTQPASFSNSAGSRG